MGIRCRLARGFSDVHPELIWRAVTEELPLLADLIREALEKETEESGAG